MEARNEHLARSHDVDRFERGHSREQIEIGLAQPIRIGNPVSDGDDDVASGISRFGGDEAIPQRVLVDECAARQAAFVRSIHGREKPRLPEHPLGPAIELDVRRQAVAENLFESSDSLALTPELVVEANDFGDEAGPQLERRRRSASDRLRGGSSHNRLTLERRDTSRGRGQSAGEPVVELVAGDKVGKYDDPRVLQYLVFEGVPQLSRSPAGRNDDESSADGCEVIS